MDRQSTAVFRKVPEGYMVFLKVFSRANTPSASAEEVRANLREDVAPVVDANRILAREHADGGAVIS